MSRCIFVPSEKVTASWKSFQGTTQLLDNGVYAKERYLVCGHVENYIDVNNKV